MEGYKMPAEKSPKKKESITEIGHGVPSNLKFGIIVAVALFWADLVKAILNGLFSLMNIKTPIVTDLILAITATALGYIVLNSYRKLKSRLEKIEV